jgi:arylsulfatase
MDIMPTLCEVAGATYPETFGGNKIIPVEGISFMPIFDGADRLAPRTLCFDHYESSAIRQGDWKLVRGNKRYKDCTWELYNIAQDRCETNNLIHANPEKAIELEKTWKEWAVRVKVAPYYTHQGDTK